MKRHTPDDDGSRVEGSEHADDDDDDEESGQSRIKDER
jgi:hypothetical protein